MESTKKMTAQQTTPLQSANPSLEKNTGHIEIEKKQPSDIASIGVISNKNALIKFDLSKQLDISFHADGWFTTGLGILIITVILVRLWLGKSGKLQDFELDEAEFGLGDQKFKLKINDDDRQIAYKIWVELSTRKIGLPIDLEHDVITEVYDSWHTFFSVTRELIKDVPVRKYRRDSTEKIVRLSIEVLNEGLRPHLTRWQARFRRWYERASGETDFVKISPQEIQQQFPHFQELADDMKIVNDRLIAYRKRMHQLIKQ